ncbi:hypothetical protein GQ43DRAFT_363051 [Delitschia confertaspora ATCC 74209]|uniref:Exportin-1/Importin-beta-like domain-containing protein n=1 Tax=Delitschia confertaspora ATCC 74209 TaxID=1513339 RepID=A0A9P4JZ18_9PLEO|nr:hypothetical protein GQ43DRAFT_363051 [Delitschia confertaspora ATCC 74209]
MAAPAAQSLSFAEVEALIVSMYQPGQASRVAQLDATLRDLQRSPQGWALADALLGSQHNEVRFFAAGTLTMKMNTEADGLSDQDSQQLLSRLINYLVKDPSRSNVTKKLCSALAQYFCKATTTWEKCVRSLACSFMKQSPCFGDALDELPSTWDIVPQLNYDHLICLLDFTMELADQGKKLGGLQLTGVHDRIAANIEDVEVLLQVSFGRGMQDLADMDMGMELAQQAGELMCSAALKCFVAWVFYAQTEINSEKLRYLRSVTELAFMCLEHNIDAMDLIAEILENYMDFFEKRHLEMLWSMIKGSWGQAILNSVDEESVMLARIIVAYAQILCEDTKSKGKLYKEPDNPHHQDVMSVLHSLIKYPKPVGVEDNVAPVAMEFWSAYTTTIAAENFEYSDSLNGIPEWLGNAKQHLFEAMCESVQKIIFPPPTITSKWDEDTKQTFKRFRIDVRDMFPEAYDVLREKLLDCLIDYSTYSFSISNWLVLEAVLFVLNAIGESLSPDSDVRLRRLFEQPLFATMAGNPGIPPAARRTAVEMVADFNSFFLRNPAFLPDVLTFLFTALGQPNLAHSSAKSFASLCSQCRKSLTGELTSFFGMYEQFLGYQTAEEFTKSRVLEGIAAIVQAQDSDDKRQAGIQKLFHYIGHDATQAVHFATRGNDVEMGQVLALTTLKCLACIGKSLQASDEEVIDLEADHNPTQYWTQGPGKDIQNQITNFVNYLSGTFVNNGEVIEAACNVLRAGYKETVPGPFVLPPSATTHFICKTNIETPRLVYVLETACCFVSSHKLNQSEEYSIEAQRLLRYILGVMQQLQHPSNDPEISVGCIEVIQRFINNNAQVLTAESPGVLKDMFGFLIECVKSPDVLPKRAAAALWKDVFDLAGNARSPHQATGQEIVNHFGPDVTFALIYNICGEVEGSSLEHIITAFRKLVVGDRNAKTYINNALQAQLLLQRAAQKDPSVAGTVRKFSEGVSRNARASTAFKETVKEFWKKCKQMQMQFAPV